MSAIIRVLLAVMFSALIILPLSAQARPKVGLVLGGGGASGVAHVGVLKVLEENNIPVDMIAGTSMGAIVGGLYASGMSAAELERVVKALDWPALFRDNPPRTEQDFHQKRLSSGFFRNFEIGIKNHELQAPSGLVAGQKLMFELRKLFAPAGHINNFDQLKIPFRAVATDLETGSPVVLKQGNLPQAVRASMAIPGFFSPVRIGDQLLVDGFVSNNVPVDVAQAMGADILIVVSIPTFLEQQDQLDSALAISYQAMQLMMLKTTQPQLEKMRPQDILIEPGLKDIGNLSFGRVKETIPLGVQAAREKLPLLTRLAVPETQLANRQTNAPVSRDPAVRIDRIEIQNDSVLKNSVLRRRLGMQEGETLNVEALRRGLERIYGLGYFELVDHRIEQQQGQNVLIIDAKKQTIGNRRLRFGLSLADDTNGDTRFQFGVSQNQRGINERGAEWNNSLILGDTLRLESRLYHPVPAHAAFIEPSVWYEERDFYFFQGEERLAEVRRDELGLKVDVGREFGNWGEARAGVFYRKGEPDVKTGQVNFLNDARIAGVQFQFNLDTMDDALLPGAGRRFRLKYTHANEALGSDEAFDQLHLQATRAWSQDKHRLIINGEAGSTFADDTPLTEQLALGGLGRMSGLYDDQLRGNHLLSAAVVYLYELANAQDVVQLYAGGTVEAGNVWQRGSEADLDDLLWTGSAFLGAETPLGLAFAGVAQTEGYEIQPFLYLGQGF